MIVSPAQGWQRAVEASRSVTRLLLLHLLPMLLLGCVAESYGLTRWGRALSELGTVKVFTLREVLPYQACHFAGGLLAVLISAFVLRGLGNTFHRREKFVPALAASVFGLGPVFLLRVCDAFPAFNPWVSWLIGAVLAAAILYQGVPRLLRLDPAHALGVYLSSILVLVLASALLRMATIMLIQPKLLGVRVAFF
jgi:hypothetical protein